MKTIVKECQTLRQAERYQNRLYAKYEQVGLIRAPMFSEDGLYAWKVAKPKAA